ncbi:universal stress protein [Mesorhizobium sp. CN5-321]|jgi:nucleotide-binding universal stress UspA family protein|uniref:universal stress protein n=1 Tax=Mesorhizobium hunchu TaxID=3157708 RepID=UPI0032B74478
MPIKTIVAILQNERDAARVLDCSLPLARQFEAHLIGVHAEAMPVPYTSASGFPDTEFLQVSADLNKERAGKLKAEFTQRTEGSGLSLEWRSLETFSGDSAISALSSVRAADLVVAGQGEEGGDSTADIGALVYDAGRPVLVVPHSGPMVTSFNRILIAWNGSREAARAAFDALPFIVQAELTEILIIDPPEDLDGSVDAGSEIAASLSRHGANVSVAAVKSGGASMEDVIQDHLSATGADLLVLGAYSHSWLRRLIFGGVTRSVLRAGAVAAFLSR